MYSSFKINLLSYFAIFNFDFLFSFLNFIVFLLQFFLIMLPYLQDSQLFITPQTFSLLDFIFILKVISYNRFSSHKIFFEYDQHLRQLMKYFYLIPIKHIFAFIQLKVLQINMMDFISY